MKNATLKPADDSLHVLIFVRDIEKSLAFYQEMLGLEKEGEVHTPFGTSHRLRYGTSLVKLMDPKQAPPAGPAGLDQQLGMRCLSFAIRNLRDVCVALEERGVDLVMPQTQVLSDTRIAMVKDPDGNVIEFVERAQS